MIHKIKLKFHEHTWLLPTLYCITALFLALVTNYIDNHLKQFLNERYTIIFTTKPELAKNVLATISGSLLTMTTITFSTIMVVLTTYASQFSPRILRNFLNNRKTMHILGIFISGFLYSIVSLLLMRNIEPDSNVITGTVAVILACVCIAFFGYFIQFVGKSIQVENLIESIAERTHKLIQEERDKFDDEHFKGAASELVVPEDYFVQSIKSGNTGYIQFINREALLKYAQEHDLVIKINVSISDFIFDNTVVLTIFCEEDKLDDVKIEVDSYFVFSNQQRELYDFKYSIEKIVDIAVRALSPGINDPNTAIECIHKLSIIVIDYYRVDANYALIEGEDGVGRLFYKRISKEAMLELAFLQIIHYGKTDHKLMAKVEYVINSIGNNSAIDEETIERFKREHVYNNIPVTD